MRNSSNFIDPTYLRAIHDGLLSGAVHKDNLSGLPIGLVGIYQEALSLSYHVNERGKFLEFFTVWALLKKEVSAEFVVPLLDGWTEGQVIDYISQYSKWFNSPVSGKYVLYHERLRTFISLNCRQHDLLKINQRIVLLLSRSQFSEVILYKFEFAVYHYLVENKGGELFFLTDTNAFIEAKKIKIDISYFYGLFEIVFSKYTTLGLTNEVGLLMRSFKQYLGIILESAFFDSTRLADDSYVRSFINELKILPINRRKVFWFNLIVDLIFNQDNNIDHLNSFLAIYDSEEDDLISTYENRNENVYSFSDYDISFDEYHGVSKDQIYLLINELIQKGVFLNWLLNRFFWLASFAEARDGFISDKLTYQQDFCQIDFCNRELVIQKLRETAIFNGGIDIYRDSNFNEQFIVLLFETQDNSPNSNVLHKPITVSSNEDVIHSRLAEFSFSANYFSLSLLERNSLMNQVEQLYHLSDKEAMEKLKDLILYLKMNENFEGEYFEGLFSSFLSDYCGATMEDVLWLHDEFLDCTKEMIRYISLSLSATQIKKLLEYISDFLEFGIWNEYIGMVPMSKSGAFSFWKNAILPLFCSDVEFTNRVVEFADIELFSRAEIIQCFCEINSEIKSDLLSLLKIDSEYLFKEFKDDSIMLYKILKKLNFSEEMIFLNSIRNDALDFKLTILLMSHGYTNELLIEKIIALINTGPSGLELEMMKHYLFPLYENLNSGPHLSRSTEYAFLGVIRNAPLKIDIQPFYQKSNHKALFLYVFRNDLRYIDGLISNLNLN